MTPTVAGWEILLATFPFLFGLGVMFVCPEKWPDHLAAAAKIALRLKARLARLFAYASCTLLLAVSGAAYLLHMTFPAGGPHHLWLLPAMAASATMVALALRRFPSSKRPS